MTVSRARKVNLGNYESEDVFIALKASLETGDEPLGAAIALEKQAATILAAVLPKDLEQRAREAAAAKGKP